MKEKIIVTLVVVVALAVAGYFLLRLHRKWRVLDLARHRARFIRARRRFQATVEQRKTQREIEWQNRALIGFHA